MTNKALFYACPEFYSIDVFVGVRIDEFIRIRNGISQKNHRNETKWSSKSVRPFPISETLPVLRPMHRTFFSHVIFNSTPRQSVCVFPGIFLKTYIKIIKQKIFNFVDIKRTKNILNIFRRYRLLNFFVHINGFLIVVSYSVLLSLTKCQSKSPPQKKRKRCCHS